MNSRAITGKAIETLTAILNLRQPLAYSQNWEAEVARPNELDKYLDCYEKTHLTEDEKYALMSLTLYAFEGAKKMALPYLAQHEVRINRAIQADYALHLPQLMYWSLPDEESDDPDCLFSITPFVRLIVLWGSAEYTSNLR